MTFVIVHGPGDICIKTDATYASGESKLLAMHVFNASSILDRSLCVLRYSEAKFGNIQF